MLSTSNSTIYERPGELLQNLIRFDTTNSPGNEAECVAYINSLLTEAGFNTTILYKDPDRPYLITRLTFMPSLPILRVRVEVLISLGFVQAHFSNGRIDEYGL